ncbi:hypothetical protein TrRE_jg4404 [Triparma retinervis]|uniref:Uncharacterized protein n=1 Tax=Triparma retinervis TaxID=2557542 RepID=A0A9W7E462_9STRA|nr:hypothetical protein TrRE_jg4404 [Triparma retinervis]
MYRKQAKSILEEYKATSGNGGPKGGRDTTRYLHGVIKQYLVQPDPKVKEAMEGGMLKAMGLPRTEVEELKKEKGKKKEAWEKQGYGGGWFG